MKTKKTLTWNTEFYASRLTSWVNIIIVFPWIFACYFVKPGATINDASSIGTRKFNCTRRCCARLLAKKEIRFCPVGILVSYSKMVVNITVFFICPFLVVTGSTYFHR